MVFVYLPSYREMKAGRASEDQKEVLSLMAELDIPVINVWDGMRAISLDRLFSYKSSHYNEFGHKTAADIVIGGLRELRAGH